MHFGRDITYCYNKDCKKTQCMRHSSNAPLQIPLSWALFNPKNNKECDMFAKRR